MPPPAAPFWPHAVRDAWQSWLQDEPVTRQWAYRGSSSAFRCGWRWVKCHPYDNRCQAHDAHNYATIEFRYSLKFSPVTILTFASGSATMRTMDIYKKDAIAPYGTQQALADALGIGRTAVTMWADDKPIPKEHELRLRYELRPDVFGVKAAKRKKAA